MIRNILDVRYNMMATVLNRTGSDVDSDYTPNLETEVKGGHWVTEQDEDTGAIRKRWVEDVSVPALPGQTYAVDVDRFDIECVARGFPEVGFRSSANNENFLDGVYQRFEAIQINFPAKYVLNRRMLITNIRGRNKQILWLEEETGQPTVFEVQGVTPTFDPFGRYLDNLAVLKRATVQ
jgi:hypothetical protein